MLMLVEKNLELLFVNVQDNEEFNSVKDFGKRLKFNNFDKKIILYYFVNRRSNYNAKYIKLHRS